MPMLVARQERTLAIDGDYIHVRFFLLYPLSATTKVLTATPEHLPTDHAIYQQSARCL
jgi:hypothetical protein